MYALALLLIFTASVPALAQFTGVDDACPADTVPAPPPVHDDDPLYLRLQAQSLGLPARDRFHESCFTDGTRFVDRRMLGVTQRAIVFAIAQLRRCSERYFLGELSSAIDVLRRADFHCERRRDLSRLAQAHNVIGFSAARATQEYRIDLNTANTGLPGIISMVGDGDYIRDAQVTAMAGDLVHEALHFTGIENRIGHSDHEALRTADREGRCDSTARYSDRVYFLGALCSPLSDHGRSLRARFSACPQFCTHALTESEVDSAPLRRRSSLEGGVLAGPPLWARPLPPPEADVICSRVRGDLTEERDIHAAWRDRHSHLITRSATIIALLESTPGGESGRWLHALGEIKDKMRIIVHTLRGDTGYDLGALQGELESMATALESRIVAHCPAGRLALPTLCSSPARPALLAEIARLRTLRGTMPPRIREILLGPARFP